MPENLFQSAMSSSLWTKDSRLIGSGLSGPIPHPSKRKRKLLLVECVEKSSFQQPTILRNLVFLHKTSRCYSFVGRVGGPQILSLGNGCGWQGTITHELGHAIGFYHEQNRSDRDEYLKIYWENIRPGEEDQFFKLLPSQNILLTPFDYESVMLYGSLTFSRDKANRLRTMEGKDGRYLKDVTSKRLSDEDVKRINMLYDCKV